MWLIPAVFVCILLIVVLVWYFRKSSLDKSLATTQPTEDNTLVSTEIRGYTMPTSRDEQLKLMEGNWITTDGIVYTFDHIDLIQDRFIATKQITNPSIITYTATGWNNNNLFAVGSDGKNATFVYEGSSMVLRTQNVSIVLIKR